MESLHLWHGILATFLLLWKNIVTKGNLWSKRVYFSLEFQMIESMMTGKAWHGGRSWKLVDNVFIHTLEAEREGIVSEARLFTLKVHPQWWVAPARLSKGSIPPTTHRAHYQQETICSKTWAYGALSYSSPHMWWFYSRILLQESVPSLE